MIESYTIPALLTLAFTVAGIFLFYFSKKKMLQKLAMAAFILSTTVTLSYIIYLWITLERPPLRTLGETRLLYTFFLPLTGLLTFFRWKTRWMPGYSFGLSCVFLLINLLRPENFDKSLMPALQSPWFAPHVIVYIIGYAILAASTLSGLKGLWLIRKKESTAEILKIADNLVYLGLAFLTFGQLFGALWAKEAWGHYWTWDPKETWAFLTWFLYLIYIHFRHHHGKRQTTALWLLSIAFLVLLICWFGVNYLPSASNSVHVYTNG